jgi:hypothetical protein
MAITMVLNNAWIMGIYTTRSWKDTSDAIRERADAANEAVGGAGKDAEANADADADAPPDRPLLV